MLAFGRRQYLRFEAVDIAALLEGITDLVARSIGPRVEVRINSPSGIGPAYADPNQVELAVLNLAVNARDAMPDGGVVTIALAEDQVADPLSHPAGLSAGDYVRITVSDTGTGMDAETLARAFEPFFTTKPVGYGSGLGLSMVQGLAAQSGGGAAIASTLGQGTTVSLWLPRAEVRDAPDEPSSAPHAPQPQPQPGACVLVVDDDPEVLAFSAASLESAGYCVARAASGAAALAMLRDGDVPALVIADLTMPGMSGETLLVAALRMYPELPVLIATGYADPGSTNAENPGLPVLAKPFKAAELVARVAELIGSRQAPVT